MGAPILVIGLGNTLLSDDGVGVHVVNQLNCEADHSAGVTLRDGGTIGLALLPQIEDAGSLIMVDAAEIAEEPGTVRVFEGAAMDRQLSGPKRTAHEVAASDLLSAAALNGCRPERRALVAIQPASICWGLEPTEAVRNGISAACEAVNSLIERWQHEIG